MTQAILIAVIASAFSIALGKALDASPLPQWAIWSILAAMLLIGLLVLQNVVSL